MSLTVILGCMFSGKSTELLRRVRRLECIGKKILVVNHKTDNRYTKHDKVVTHCTDSMDCVKTTSLLHITGHDNYKNTDTIAIDEAQFFPDLYQFVLTELKQNKTVIVSGLVSDFQCNPIGDILRLLPHADDTVRLYALCSMCNNGTRAAFTKRLTNDKQQVLIGTDQYAAVCRNHFTV
jgi:thymidine kinase